MKKKKKKYNKRINCVEKAKIESYFIDMVVECRSGFPFTSGCNVKFLLVEKAHSLALRR